MCKLVSVVILKNFKYLLFDFPNIGPDSSMQVTWLVFVKHSEK